MVSALRSLFTKLLAPTRLPKPIFFPGKMVVLVQIIEKGSNITPLLILLGGIGSLVKITYGKIYTYESIFECCPI